MEFEFSAKLWLWTATNSVSWTFVTLPPELGAEVQDLVGASSGFGSVRVEVTTGDATWRTSLFPNAESASYVLPIKAAIRQSADITEGDSADFRFRVLLEE